MFFILVLDIMYIYCYSWATSFSSTILVYQIQPRVTVFWRLPLQICLDEAQMVESTTAKVISFSSHEIHKLVNIHFAIAWGIFLFLDQYWVLNIFFRQPRWHYIYNVFIAGVSQEPQYKRDLKVSESWPLPSPWLRNRAPMLSKYCIRRINSLVRPR